MELSGIMLVEYNGRSALFPLQENSNPGLLIHCCLNLAVSEGQEIVFPL